MQDGMNIDQATLIEVQQQKLAASAVREAQMEAGIQQLLKENQKLMAEIERLSAHEEVDVVQGEDWRP